MTTTTQYGIRFVALGPYLLLLRYTNTHSGTNSRAGHQQHTPPHNFACPPSPALYCNSIAVACPASILSAVTGPNRSVPATQVRTPTSPDRTHRTPLTFTRCAAVP